MEKKVSAYDSIQSIFEERIDEISDFELVLFLNLIKYHAHLKKIKKGEKSTFSPLQTHFI